LRKGDATRARILQEAAKQAAQRGLSAVSLSDVASAVGLSKSGLFKHFDSKEAMQLAVVGQICRQFIEVVWEPAVELPPGRPRLDAAFKGMLYWAEELWAESGCPICAFSLELDDQPGPLRDHLREKLDMWRGLLVEEFKALRDPPLPLAEAQLAYFQMRSFQLGQADACRMMEDGGARRLALAAFDALLDRLSHRAAA
jgi:AcrR family transcriptional regulator